MSGIDIDIERIIELLRKLGDTYPNYFDEFDEKKYKPSDLRITARAINSWKENELLVDTDKKGWHKFNLTECIWLKIIQNLREFNLPLEAIRKIKNQLLTSSDVNLEFEQSQAIEKLISVLKKEGLHELEEVFKSSEFQDIMRKQKLMVLENLILDLIFTRSNFRLLFNLNGELMAHKDNYEEELRNIPLYMNFIKTTHISISLNKLIYELTNELIEDDDLQKLSILTEQEFKVIESIRKEDIKKVEIIFSKDQKPELIKITQVNIVESISKIKDFFIQGGYQDIKITTQDGRINYFENTIKIKV